MSHLEEEPNAPGAGPSLRTNDLVGRLWADVAQQQRSNAAAVPELGLTTRMIHDADLMHLDSHRDVDHGELMAHLVPLLTSLAERRDELIDELRLLREAIVSESRRLAERDDLLHHLLEVRLERLEQDGPAS